MAPPGHVEGTHEASRHCRHRRLATGINDAGQIAGSTSCCHAFVISGGVRTTLPDLSNYGCCPGGLSGASGINNNGQIVANGYNAQGQEHAFLLTPG